MNSAQKTDYSVYTLSAPELIQCISEAVLLMLAITYLFYESLWALLPMIPVPFLFIRLRKKQKAETRRRKMNEEFRDALNSMSVALKAGYSAENAVQSCSRDLKQLYGPESDLYLEFCYMESQMHLSVPAEKLFLDLGKRTGIEDIENFAAVFYTAKRTGGNIPEMVRRMAGMVGDKIDVQKEITAAVASKKAEQTFMSLMPAGIILYLKWTSGGFLSVMYGNPLGACFMTVCLLIYLGAYYLGERIVRIEV